MNQENIFELDNITSETTSKPYYLQNLNPPQLEGATHCLGPIMVLAGAGTGKTRVLTRRIAHLVLHHKVFPSQILAVTFTNKAAAEMKQRLEGLLQERAKELWIATFHSAALRILRRNAHHLGYENQFSIFDDDDTKTLLKKIIEKRGVDDKKFPASSFQRGIDRLKNEALTPEDFSKQVGHNYNQQILSEVYYDYQNSLRASGGMDFGDLILNTLLLFKRHPDVLAHYQRAIKFLLVDEFQDTNKVQYELVTLIAGERKNIFVVGDDDQSIYKFRGADVENMFQFEKDFAGTKTVTLEQNYRSTSNILEAAHAVIEKNKKRKPKKLWTEGDKGSKITTYVGFTEKEEADFIARVIRKIKAEKGLKYNECAIFSRTNAQTRSIEEALVSYRIPYKIYGGMKFYERKEIKDLIAYLRVSINPNDNISFLRVINTPTRGIGAQTLQSIIENANELHTSYFEASKYFAHKNKGVAAFNSIVLESCAKIESGTVAELIEHILKATEYEEKLKASKDIQAESRIENIYEFKAAASAGDLAGSGTARERLQEFLDKIALVGGDENTSTEGKHDVDPNKKVQDDVVQVMTLHLAKGLEFEAVFFTGMEEGLLPHYRSIDDPVACEEERRLCYVGITRARSHLYVTRAMKRSLFSSGGDFGTTSTFRECSRFIMDIPQDLFEHKTNPIWESALGDGFDDIQEECANIKSSRWEHNKYGDDYSLANKYAKSKNTIAAPKKALPYNLVTPGDALSKLQEENKYNHLPYTDFEDLKVGIKVVHPTHGEGEVVKVEGEAGNKKSKVSILFKEGDSPKSFIFQLAGLRKIG